MPAIDGSQANDLSQNGLHQEGLNAPQASDVVAEDAVRVTHHRGHAKISLTGEVGPFAVESLHECMIRLLDADKDLVIDCAKAEHLPASALQVLLAAQMTLATRQRTVRIESESPAIREYLNLAGLADRFPPKAPAVRTKRKNADKVNRQL